MKEVYVFMCSANRNLHGFTCDSTGSNLPPDVCSGIWQLFKEIKLTIDSKRIMGSNPKDSVNKKIEKDGYFLNLSAFKFFDI